MSQEHRQALRRASQALASSVASIADPAERASVQDAIDDIEDELSNLVVDDLLKATEAVRRAAAKMEDVLDTINAHALQQVKAEVQTAFAKLQQLGGDA